MANQNSAAVIALELERVDDLVPTLFDHDALFYSNVEKVQPLEVSYRDARVPMELRPGGKFGYFSSDGVDMGRGGGYSYDKALVPVVEMKHALEWTKKSEWGTDTARKAVLGSFRRNMATAMKEFRRQVEGQAMTAGDGVVATVTSVNTAGAKDTYTCTTDGFGVKLIRFGQNVNVYNAALTVNRTVGAEVEVDNVDLAAKTFRVSTNVAGSAATDKIVASGLSATPPVGLLGVPYHHNNASTGFWLSYDRATTPEIRANRVAAGGALTLPFPRLALNKIGDRVGLDNMSTVEAWMHPCQKQAYEEIGQLVSVIQKQARDESLDLYFGDNMQMAGAPVRVSFMWDKTRIDFIAKKVWGRVEVRKPGFYDVEGRRIFEVRGATGGIVTAQLFYLAVVMNLYVNNPAACAYIDTLSVTSGY